MTDYMAIDTDLPPYFPYPQFLMDMPLSHTAALTYALLLDRAHLSQLNGWTDEAGRVYLIFPVEKIAAALKRSLSSAKNALSELSAAGLIERKRRGQFLPNLIYVKLPDGQRIVPSQTDKELSHPRRTKDCPSQGQKMTFGTVRKQDFPQIENYPQIKQIETNK